MEPNVNQQQTNTPQPSPYQPSASPPNPPQPQPAMQPPGLGQAPTIAPTPKPKKRKLWLIILVVAILLLAGASAGAYMYSSNRAGEDSATSNEASGEVEKEDNEELSKPKIGVTPLRVIYAFREKDTDPYTIYSRPADGGERTELFTAGTTGWGRASTNGQVYLVYDEFNIWVSTDKGVSFKNILKSQETDPITSAVVSYDGKIVYAIWPGYYDQTEGDKAGGQLRSMEPGGTADKLVKQLTTAGYLVGADVSNNIVLYRQGCYNCDGVSGTVYKYDPSTQAETTVFSPKSEYTTLQKVASVDATKLLYLEYSIDQTPPAEGCFGECVTGPVSLVEVEVDSGESRTLATFEEADYQDKPGYDQSAELRVGYAYDSNGAALPYYTNTDNQVILVSGSKPSTMYESSQTLRDVMFVSGAGVIAASGKYDNYILNNFNPANQQNAQILNGDTNTILLIVASE